jgi:hypothetical protein
MRLRRFRISNPELDLGTRRMCKRDLPPVRRPERLRDDHPFRDSNLDLASVFHLLQHQFVKARRIVRSVRGLINAQPASRANGSATSAIGGYGSGEYNSTTSRARPTLARGVTGAFITSSTAFGGF